MASVIANQQSTLLSEDPWVGLDSISGSSHIASKTVWKTLGHVNSAIANQPSTVLSEDKPLKKFRHLTHEWVLFNIVLTFGQVKAFIFCYSLYFLFYLFLSLNYSCCLWLLGIVKHIGQLELFLIVLYQ